MEDIFQVLIFVAFAAIGILQQVRKDKKETPNTSPHEVLEDMFPELNQETEIPMAEPITQQQPIRKKRKTPKKEMFQTKEHHPVPPKQSATSKQTDKKIRLSSKEEARRAFIYSEIFNRKY